MMTSWITVRGPMGRVPVVLASLVFVGIVVLSLIPGTIVSPVRWNLGHILAYAAFVTCAIFSVVESRRTPSGLLAIGVMASLFGGGIELIQPIMGRRMSLIDFTSNEVGVLLALLSYGLYAYIVMLFSRRPGRKSPKSHRE